MIDFNDPFNGLMLVLWLFILIIAYIAFFGKNTKDLPSKSRR